MNGVKRGDSDQWLDITWRRFCWRARRCCFSCCSICALIWEAVWERPEVLVVTTTVVAPALPPCAASFSCANACCFSNLEYRSQNALVSIQMIPNISTSGNFYYTGTMNPGRFSYCLTYIGCLPLLITFNNNYIWNVLSLSLHTVEML